MQISNNFSFAAIQAVRGGENSNAAKNTDATTAGLNVFAPQDQVDLSAEAQSLLANPSTATGELRTERIADIRRQIAAGTYDTDERMSEALDKFMASFS